jgi:AAA ATPase domain/AAA domain
MRLSGLDLEGFQRFPNVQHLEIAPLTLIFGPNSSGKSSILRSLLLLEQSLKTSKSGHDSVFPLTELTFRGHGDRIRRDLGSFQNMVSFHDSSRRIQIGYEFSTRLEAEQRDTSPRSAVVASRRMGLKRQDVFIKFLMSFSSPGNLEQIDITLSQGDDRSSIGRARVQVRRSNSEDGIDFDTQSPTPAIEMDLVSVDEGFVGAMNAWLLGFEARIAKHLSHSKWNKARQQLFNDSNTLFSALQHEMPVNLKNGFPGGVFFDHQAEVLGEACFRFLHDLGRRFSLTASSVAAVEALRDIPRRYDSLEGPENAPLEDNGANILRWLNADPLRLDQISRLLERVTDRYTLNLKKFTDLADEDNFLQIGALQLIEQESQTAVRFEDVGVGLSQLLPILAQLVVISSAEMSSPSPLPKIDSPKTLVIEQPELHLHPKMQAELMDLIIETIAKAPPHSKSIILETHSESMLLRLQRWLRSGDIAPSLVSIAYVEPAAGGSKIQKLEIAKDGVFETRWPVSFSGLRRQDSL